MMITHTIAICKCNSKEGAWFIQGVVLAYVAKYSNLSRSGKILFFFAKWILRKGAAVVFDFLNVFSECDGLTPCSRSGERKDK